MNIKIFFPCDWDIYKCREWRVGRCWSKFDPNKQEGDRMDAVRGWTLNSQLRRLIERDGLYCCWCGSLCDPRKKPSSDLFPTREHVVRLADGGSSRMENLKVACRKCNNSRHHVNWKPEHKELE